MSITKSIPTVEYLNSLKPRIIPVLEKILAPCGKIPWHEAKIYVETYAKRLVAYQTLADCLNTEFCRTPKDNAYTVDFLWAGLSGAEGELRAKEMKWSNIPSLKKYNPNLELPWLYFHQAHLIWVPGNKPLSEAECLAGLTHEFVHVFQYNMFPCFERAINAAVKGNKKDAYHNALKTLQEGHACVVTLAVGKELGFVPQTAYVSETEKVNQLGVAETRFFLSHPELLTSVVLERDFKDSVNKKECENHV
ncbi:MAG: hypothetical protein Q7K43_06315 [Candidatus Woesearchaeota archaeon]|nr:hypothetical protein [Candidatus Woesearchaeota archaeon]